MVQYMVPRFSTAHVRGDSLKDGDAKVYIQ